MTQYMYHVEEFDSTPFKTAIKNYVYDDPVPLGEGDILQLLGDRGWEMVSAIHIRENTFRYYFKKIKT